MGISSITSLLRWFFLSAKKAGIVIISLFSLASTSLAANEITTTIHPIGIDSKKGQHSSQPLTVLQYQDQQQNDNNWSTYIEFTSSKKRYSGTIYFQAPDSNPLTKLQLNVNYLGPDWSYQHWTWALWNYHTRRWDTIGNNKHFPSWLWQPASFTVDQNPNYYIGQNREIKLRYWSNNGNDNSDIDYLALEVTRQSDDNDGGTAPPPPNTSIWIPAPGSSWQWQLTGTVDTSIEAQIYDIDLFDVPAETIAELKALERNVICYFSAGSWEDWRSDADLFPESIRGNSNGWPGERWLDIRQVDLIMPIMEARMDLAVSKGCDAVEPDNMDGYTHESGFNISYADQLYYAKLLANAAHSRNQSIGLKNNLDQVNDLLPYFDWALNESCMQYNECELLTPFVEQGKAVFHTEYDVEQAPVCELANQLGFSSIIKHKNLDAWLLRCD